MPLTASDGAVTEVYSNRFPKSDDEEYEITDYTKEPIRRLHLIGVEIHYFIASTRR